MANRTKQKSGSDIAAPGTEMNPKEIRCIVFDFYRTLCSDRYFKLAPPECPAWHELFDRHVFAEDSPVLDRWMAGELTTTDIARLMTEYIPMDISDLVRLMELGCENLTFNAAVMDFAVRQKAQGRNIALVTGNMDVFTKIVVPAHGLDELFDVILNTSDYGETRKEHLWPMAFRLLGGGIQYHNSLLIEDGTENPGKFRARGGYACQYRDDARFSAWLASVGMGSDS